MENADQRFIPYLDDMLTREEAAGWLKMSVRELGEKSRGNKPKIPAFKPGQKTTRYHPRTILAKLAHDAGVPLDVVAASYGVRQDRSAQ